MLTVSRVNVRVGLSVGERNQGGTMKIQVLWLSVSAGLWLGWCGGAAAQTVASAPDAGSGGSMTEVVVTAERRHTDLQTTPISATVLTGSDLSSMGVATVDQLQFATPGAT